MTESGEGAARWFASHELRTPLQAIRGGVELLLAERGAGLSALQIEALGLIAGASAELERTIEMLADLAALDAQPAAAVETEGGAIAPHDLATWLAEPAVAQYLRPTARTLAAAGVRVHVAPQLIARGLNYLAGASATGDAGEPVLCDLAAIEADVCVLGLTVPDMASGNGAVARHLAAALLTKGGAGLQSDGSTRALLTLRRAG